MTVDITNPGLVNAADFADGPVVIDQEIQVSPSYNPGPTIAVADEAFGKGIAADIHIP